LRAQVISVTLTRLQVASGGKMRAVSIALAAGLTLTGCATKPEPAVVAGPTCPSLKVETWGPVLDKAKSKAFDAELARRFGAAGAHILVDRATDAKGDIIVTGRRIGPASFAMPEAGKGGEVQAVFQACTHKVLKTRKLADLEANPKPIPPNDDPAT
jgi:hypothetical protein